MVIKMVIFEISSIGIRELKLSSRCMYSLILILSHIFSQDHIIETFHTLVTTEVQWLDFALL